MSKIQQLLTEHIDIWTSAETEKKSGRGRASGSAGKVYGIQKLRSLILELAVRGKLVSHDANDEPASELLKRIQAENAKLIAEGKLKKEKPLRLISEDEKSFDIPNNWVYARVNDTGQYINGLAFKPNEWGNVGRPIIRIQNLSGRSQDFNRTEKKVDDSVIVRTGDILVSWSATLDVFIWNLNEDGVLNQHIFRVIPEKLISKNYLCWLLKAAIREMEDSVHAHGLVMTHINRGPFLSHVIGLPPLPEQHRIVAKVDELMALCDQLETQHSNAAEAHERLVSHLLGTLTQSESADDFSANWQRIAVHFDTLFTTETSIDAFKQTLLQLAVMGKLVPQDANDEPASELLKRIQAEKVKLVVEGKIKKEKSLATISDNESPYELPKGWKWTSLLNAAVINPRNAASDNIKASFVPMTLIGSEFTDKHQDEKKLWKEIKQGFTHFSEGDIGVAKITPCFENSKACVFENLENGLGAGTTELHIVRPLANTLNSRYVLAYLKSPRFLELGESKMTGTAGQKRLPKDFVETNPFPLPPLSEQHRIVAKVDKLMALCDQLKTRIQQANQQQQTIANVLVAQVLN